MSEFSVVVEKIKADIASAEKWFKNIPWVNVGTDIQVALADVETVIAPLVKEFFPGTTSTINAVVNPVLNQANIAAQAAVTAAQQYSAGTLTGAALTQAVHTAQAAAVAAAALVEAAVAKSGQAPGTVPAGGA